MEICEVLSRDRIIVGVKSRDKIGVIQEMLDVTATSGQVLSKEQLFESLLEREQLQTTGVGFDLAIAHAKTDAVEGVVLSLGISHAGVEYDSLDGKPARLIFMLVAPPDKNTEYLSVLAKIARIFKEETFREAVMHAATSAGVMDLITQREASRYRC